MDAIQALERTQNVYAQFLHRFSSLFLVKFGEYEDVSKIDVPVDQILERVSFPACTSVFILNEVMNNIENYLEKDPTYEEMDDICIKLLDRVNNYLSDFYSDSYSPLRSDMVH